VNQYCGFRGFTFARFLERSNRAAYDSQNEHHRIKCMNRVMTCIPGMTYRMMMSDRIKYSFTDQLKCNKVAVANNYASLEEAIESANGIKCSKSLYIPVYTLFNSAYMDWSECWFHCNGQSASISSANAILCGWK
jgi:hypothetical protein